MHLPGHKPPKIEGDFVQYVIDDVNRRRLLTESIKAIAPYIRRLSGHVPDTLMKEMAFVSSIKQKKIFTPLRMAHLLGQCKHESQNFQRLEENLNYSAEGLTKTFGKYFPGDLEKSYERQPRKIANRVYGNRMGNGDEASDEGWKYRGRGYIQLTGKNNYKAFSDYAGFDYVKNPELVADLVPFESSVWYFTEFEKIYLIADRGSSVEVVTEVTKKINPACIGLEDRIKSFNFFNKLLMGLPNLTNFQIQLSRI